jgi:quercetin dioxygenase-like cupin family protein
MTIRVPVLTAALALLYCLPANSQTKAPNPDPGVTPIRLIDRAEVRVTRVELQPGAVRSVHTHDDVKFHLWIPVSGQLEIAIGSAKPEPAEPGRAVFMEKGTRHGFRNTGSSMAVVMEVFIKESSAVAERDALSLGLALASIETEAKQ